jgi:glycosyltransferase involved in cell wall biosynthesis
MGRLHHLRQSLPLLASQPRVRCIVVDYGCPDDAGGWVEQNHPQVLVVRAVGVGGFNISKARNLGALHATTPWLCFMDADTLVDADFHRHAGAALAAGHFFLADPCPLGLTGLVVCRRDDFSGIGGYDELFSGWGCEDLDLYARLALSGRKQGSFPGDALRVIAHDDSERMRHYETTDRLHSLRINGMYFQIKTDLARLTEVVELPLVDRREIYARVRQLVSANRRTAVKMEIALPWVSGHIQPPGARLGRTISYCSEPLATPSDG